MAGGDKLFHRRKARAAFSHKRKEAKLDSYDQVLIVCEGEKTEFNYFKELINDFELNTANVKVADNTEGSSPRSVINFALEKFHESKKEGKVYDKIYCVIDRDRHGTYHEALGIAKNAKIGNSIIEVITSTPCFEYWILLHYINTAKYYYHGVDSVCAKVISDLKKHIPDYEKGNKYIYSKLKEKLPDALVRSRIIDQNHNGIDEFCSNTTMHKIIFYLSELKDKKNKTPNAQ